MYLYHNANNFLHDPEESWSQGKEEEERVEGNSPNTFSSRDQSKKVKHNKMNKRTCRSELDVTN